LIDSKKITFSRFREFDVPRETFERLELFQSMIIEKNKEINLISSKTEAILWDRHILDSAQTIDFIDKNIKICTDIGAGAGLPGIVLGILMKEKNPDFKVIFYEKSYHKSLFLKKVAKTFNLKTEIYQKNIFKEKNLETDTIIARAFKPLPIILDIALTNFKIFKNIILFLGRTGKNILKESSKKWKFDYEEKISLTSQESILVKISNLKRIYE
tara:strand:- start:1416 stop:2057 length:642 start_codon:yes stop_codon:yes gene_type:complete